MSMLEIKCNNENEIKLVRTSGFEIQHQYYKKEDGTQNEYIYYRFTIPPYLHSFINDIEDYTYFYICHDRLYMCKTQPPSYFPQQRYKIRVRMEGCDITFPTKLVNPGKYESIAIIVYMNKKDFITGQYGLVELKLV